MQKINLSSPWDSIWDGGLSVPSFTLIGGPPGSGKTTMMLQMVAAIGGESLYITPEVPLGALKETASRLHVDTSRMALSHEDLLEMPRGLSVIVLDTISSMHRGSADLLNTAARWQKYARETNTPVLCGVHSTRDGDYAGPIALQHMADMLVTIEQADGDSNESLREACVWKNRYGATLTGVMLLMTPTGLVAAPQPPQSKAK